VVRVSLCLVWTQLDRALQRTCQKRTFRGIRSSVAKSRHGVNAQHEAVLERHTTRFRAGRQPDHLAAPALGRGGCPGQVVVKEVLFQCGDVCCVRQQTGEFCAAPFLRFRQCGSCRRARAGWPNALRPARHWRGRWKNSTATVARTERARQEGEGAASQLCEEEHRGGDVRARQHTGGGSAQSLRLVWRRR
jgi:hypothetical protein